MSIVSSTRAREGKLPSRVHYTKLTHSSFDRCSHTTLVYCRKFLAFHQICPLRFLSFFFSRIFIRRVVRSRSFSHPNRHHDCIDNVSIKHTYQHPPLVKWEVTKPVKGSCLSCPFAGNRWCSEESVGENRLVEAKRRLATVKSLLVH